MSWCWYAGRSPWTQQWQWDAHSPDWWWPLEWHPHRALRAGPLVRVSIPDVPHPADHCQVWSSWPEATEGSPGRRYSTQTLGESEHVSTWTSSFGRQSVSCCVVTRVCLCMSQSWSVVVGLRHLLSCHLQGRRGGKHHHQNEHEVDLYGNVCSSCQCRWQRLWLKNHHVCWVSTDLAGLHHAESWLKIWCAAACKGSAEWCEANRCKCSLSLCLVRKIQPFLCNQSVCRASARCFRSRLFCVGVMTAKEKKQKNDLGHNHERGRPCQRKLDEHRRGSKNASAE